MLPFVSIKVFQLMDAYALHFCAVVEMFITINFLTTTLMITSIKTKLFYGVYL